MTLEQVLAAQIGQLTIANAKLSLTVEALQKQLSERNGIIAELQGKIAVLKVCASEPELPIVAKGNGHAEATTH